MKLLVAEDSRVYRSMLKSLLDAWGYEVILAADGEEARSILLRHDAPRIALLDCMMPGLSGLELCQLIRQGPTYIYTILLSANDERGQVLEGFELGADDYLRKPFQELELRARLKVGERIIRAQQELIEARESLKFEATHDSMLRVWNRAAILDLLAKELIRAGRFHSPLSVFLSDVDFFKRINDTHGHLVGDDVLRAVANRMTQAVRRYDSVGRYGGEEFLAVLPDCNEEAAREVAERVRRQISDEPILTAPMKIEITASFGVCQWQDGMESHDLLRQTDLALYRAKDEGRNQVQVAIPEPQFIKE